MSTPRSRRTATGRMSVRQSLLEAWQTVLVNRAKPYALQQPNGTYRWVYEPLGLDLLLAHLRGDCTVAVSSSDEEGRCRWLCLDADQADALPHLLELAAALAELGLPGLVEASRRGGHLWLLLDAPTPAAVARRAVFQHLEDLRTASLPVPTIELYPNTTAAGSLGHAVRLPLGIHRLTGRRYPLFDEQGSPCAFTTPEAAVRFLLKRPRIASARLARPAGEPEETEAVEPVERAERIAGQPEGTLAPSSPLHIGTRSLVIRWVDEHVTILDLLAELAPFTELHLVGRGYLGWCPFHDDRAPDEQGRPGTPSFYVVHDRRYGWSWRCFSTNCAQSVGPLRHSFRLLQDLLELTASQAIREACARWPEADADKQLMVERGDLA
jgi:hypothetical protein